MSTSLLSHTQHVYLIFPLALNLAELPHIVGQPEVYVHRASQKLYSNGVTRNEGHGYCSMSSTNSHVPVFYQTSLTKRKSKDKIIKYFKTVIVEH